MESLHLSALDLRLGLMAIVLAVMAVAFHGLTGNFLTPENLYNIAQQTAVVGIVATAVALVIGFYQGGLTAYLGVPSFVVTLGGLMSFRGAAFLVANGKTQPITDPVFLWFGGGLDGALGIVGSWTLALVLGLLLVWRIVQARRA